MTASFVLRQVDPPGASIALALNPSSITESGGAGGWDEVEHAKRVSSTEYIGQPLRRIEVPMLFDGWRKQVSVEEPLRVLRVWAGIQPGQTEPAVLQVVYGTYTPLRWVVQDLAFGDELRNGQGVRVRAQVTVSLLEYRAAVLALTPVQQAKAAAKSSGKSAPSGKTYTVKAGDKLARIAQSQLGKAARWPEIAKLNGLRDPDRLTVGQRLRLPA